MMTVLFTGEAVTIGSILASVGEGITAILGIVSSTIAWAVGEPLILLSLGVSIAGIALKFFRNG